VAYCPARTFAIASYMILTAMNSLAIDSPRAFPTLRLPQRSPSRLARRCRLARSMPSSRAAAAQLC